MTDTKTSEASKWIEHDRGVSPVSGETYVECLSDKGFCVKAPAEMIKWWGVKMYRVVKP